MNVSLWISRELYHSIPPSTTQALHVFGPKVKKKTIMETWGCCFTTVNFCCYEVTKQNSVYTNDCVPGSMASAITHMYVFHGLSQCLGCVVKATFLLWKWHNTTGPFPAVFFPFFSHSNDMSCSLNARIEFPIFLHGKDSGKSQRRHRRNKTVHTKNTDDWTGARTCSLEEPESDFPSWKAW